MLLKNRLREGKHSRNQTDSVRDILQHQGKLLKQSKQAYTIPALGTAHRCPLECVRRLNMNGLPVGGMAFSLQIFLQLLCCPSAIMVGFL